MESVISINTFLPRLCHGAEVINLKKMALMKVAMNFWEQKVIKSNVLEFSSNSHSALIQNPEVKLFINDLISKHSLMMEILPPEIKDKSIYIIKNLGLRIMEWLMDIVKILQKDCKNFKLTMREYINNIIWTRVGTIDSLKIFKKIFDDELVDEPYLLYVQAAEHHLADYLFEWKKRYTDTKEIFSDVIMEYQKTHHFPSDIYNNEHEYNNYELNYPLNTTFEVFQAAVNSGNVTAVEYCIPTSYLEGYYPHIEPLEKGVLSLSQIPRGELKIIHSDVFAYLISQILKRGSLYQFRKQILKKPLFVFFLFSWPWCDYFSAFAKWNLGYCDGGYFQFESILIGLIARCDSMATHPGFEIKDIISYFLEAIQVELYVPFFSHDFFFKNVPVLNEFNIELSGIIVNHPSVRDLRPKIIDQFLIFHYIKICENDIEDNVAKQREIAQQFDAFKEKVLLSDAERKSIDDKINTVQQYGKLIGSDPESIENFTKSNYSSVINMINSAITCPWLRIDENIAVKMFDREKCLIEDNQNQTKAFSSILGAEKYYLINQIFRGYLDVSLFFINLLRKLKSADDIDASLNNHLRLRAPQMKKLILTYFL